MARDLLRHCRAVPADGTDVSEIRPCERDDLQQVAALYELVMRSGSSTPARGLDSYLERVLFDQRGPTQRSPRSCSSTAAAATSASRVRACAARCSMGVHPNRVLRPARRGRTRAAQRPERHQHGERGDDEQREEWLSAPCTLRCSTSSVPTTTR